MTTIRLVAGAAIALAGCYVQQPPAAQYADPQQYSGPPGGQMDQPSIEQYEQDSQPAESQGSPQYYGAPGADPGYAPDGTAGVAEPQPSADPQDPGYAMGPVTDGEIDSTLGNYGDWVEDPEYGRVWRPYATVVGVDFTPYETCGSWMWTDWGWSYNCDWDWGWLPFHYGRWSWMDAGYWGWVPGTEWGPGWVEWRNGGGYVGWRPLGPEFHDHRGQHQGPTFHDHRTGSHDSHWRFVSTNDFGKGHIRGHLYNDLAEGLRVTQPVTRPPLRGTTQPIHVASIMAPRLNNAVWRQQHAPAGGWRQPMTPHEPGSRPPQLGVQQQWHQPREQEPTWRQPPQRNGWNQPQPQSGWRQPPSRGQVWSPPPTQHPTWTREPTRPTYGGPYGGGGSYNPPARTWNAPRPSAPSWSPPPSRPSAPSWSPPSHSSSWGSPSSSGGYSAPSHSSGGYSAPSHSSGGSFGGGGGGHSFGGGGGGHSSGGGGGGHHR